MASTSFCVYIDESGDEGFVFQASGHGSSHWLVLSAVVVKKEHDLALVGLMDTVRGQLGRLPRQPLHFVKLAHAQRIPYVREISKGQLATVSVLIYKPAIKDPVKFTTYKHSLYRYATRFLLERVSWLCRDQYRPGHGDGHAEVIFSNRGQMSYDEIRDYLRRLQEQTEGPPCSIYWPAIDPALIRAVEHSKLAGLQVADAVASSLYCAVNLNPYGDAEDKYARLLLPTFYRGQMVAVGYGLKFWPERPEALAKAQPHLAWFAAL